MIPAELRTEYEDWHTQVVWQSAPQVTTCRLTHPSGEVRFLKVATVDWFPRLPAETDRMVWARPYLPVPEVVARGSDGRVDWLVTKAMPGRDATDPALRGDPRALVCILARGLRSFHDAPVQACPFDFRLDSALMHARRRLAEGRIRPKDDFHEEHAHLTAAAAVERLERLRPRSESLVVCHGDYCLPNVLVADAEAVGFVDLGELGVSDRWWDLAVATWSVTWNLGGGHEALFLGEYGVEPDPARLAFYRLLYDVVS